MWAKCCPIKCQRHQRNSKRNWRSIYQKCLKMSKNGFNGFLENRQRIISHAFAAHHYPRAYFISKNDRNRNRCSRIMLSTNFFEKVKISVNFQTSFNRFSQKPVGTKSLKHSQHTGPLAPTSYPKMATVARRVRKLCEKQLYFSKSEKVENFNVIRHPTLNGYEAGGI